MLVNNHLTTIALVLVSLASAAPKIPGYKMVWSDDFKGPKNSLPSSKNWIIDQGTSYPGGPANWGTGEIQTYTNSLTNVALDGKGHLLITPRKSQSGSWTSARIETVRTNFAPPKNGRMVVQASIALPAMAASRSQGIWTAFWMLGGKYRGDYQNWPCKRKSTQSTSEVVNTNQNIAAIGEFDILENVNGVNQAFGTLHCGTNPGGVCNESNGLGSSLAPAKGVLQGKYHTYRVTVNTKSNPQTLTWSLDGQDFGTITNHTLGAETWREAVLNGKFILLNVAVGGGWPGLPNAKTASGVPMKVDWVGVYYG